MQLNLPPDRKGKPQNWEKFKHIWILARNPGILDLHLIIVDRAIGHLGEKQVDGEGLMEN